MNRSEIWTLKRKLNVINKESDHFNAMLIRNKRDIELKLKDIQKCSGHSIMSLPLTAQDKHIKDSPLFNTGIILSEKQFQSWRIKERQIEKQYKIKELQRQEEMNRQRYLIQLLEDLKIISHKTEVYAGETEEGEANMPENAIKIKKFPLIFEKLIKKKVSQPYDQRPVTVDCASIQRRYIDITTKASTPINFDRKMSLSLFLEENCPAPKPKGITEKRSKSASTVKQSICKQKPLTPSIRSASKRIARSTDNSENINISLKPAAPTERPKCQENRTAVPTDEVQTEYFPFGFAQMPRWKRQLLMEAPVGLNDSISPAKVHVIMSQAQKRRDLEILISTNVADIKKLAKEKAEEQRRKVEYMQATLREMDQLEQGK